MSTKSTSQDAHCLNMSDRAEILGSIYQGMVESFHYDIGDVTPFTDLIDTHYEIFSQFCKDMRRENPQVTSVMASSDEMSVSFFLIDAMGEVDTRVYEGCDPNFF